MAKQPESREGWEARERARLGDKQFVPPPEPATSFWKTGWGQLVGLFGVLLVIGTCGAAVSLGGGEETPSNSEASETEYVFPFGCEYVLEEMIGGLLYLGVEYGVTLDETALRAIFTEERDGVTFIDTTFGEDSICFWASIAGWVNSQRDGAEMWKEAIIEGGDTPIEGLRTLQAVIEAYKGQSPQ